jgi:anthranilate phosphoribosyltransferase
MRAHVTRVPVAEAIRSTLVDTCGTGGAPKTFNVSTAAAIITAAAGQGRLRVAKHGNRSRTGRGSAEVLQTMGVNVDASPEVQARCLDRAGVCFCFAIHHHPAMRHASGPRKALGFPTIFNLLGPLTNPADAPRQVLGVYDRSLVEPMAGALLALGASSAMVVHGLDGLDELTTTGSSIIGEVSGGSVRFTEFDPVSIGLPRVRLEDLVAPDLAASAAMVLDIVRGARTPGRDLALLNAAAALVVGGLAKSLREGVELAASAVDRGEAARTLERLIHESHATGLS